MRFGLKEPFTNRSYGTGGSNNHIFSTHESFLTEGYKNLRIQQKFSKNKQLKLQSQKNNHGITNNISLQTHAPLPWNEIILVQQYGFGCFFAAGGADAIFQDLFSHFFNGFFTFDHRTGVDINDVCHSFRQL